MTQLLRVDSSLFGEHGVSSQLMDELIAELRNQQPLEVVNRRLDADMPHFSASTIEAIGSGEAALADTLIDEIKASDIVVIAAPMYNFGIPSTLKSWFDHVARAGVTFRYTENGPVGLLENKRVYVVTTRGGRHRDSATDSQVPFLKTMLSFIGLIEVEFIYAEGLNMGPDGKTQGMNEARTHIAELTKTEATL